MNINIKVLTVFRGQEHIWAPYWAHIPVIDIRPISYACLDMPWRFVASHKIPSIIFLQNWLKGLYASKELSSFRHVSFLLNFSSQEAFLFNYMFTLKFSSLAKFSNGLHAFPKACSHSRGCNFHYHNSCPRYHISCLVLAGSWLVFVAPNF
jgi:hypothetical protein